MGKKKGPAWDFFKEKNKGVVCKYCAKEYKQSNVNKMTKHIKKCFKCPEDLKKYLESQTTNLPQNIQTPPESRRKSGEGLGEGKLQVYVPSFESEQGPSSAGSQRPGSALSSKSDMSIASTVSLSHETEPSFVRPLSRASNVGGGLLSFIDTMDTQINVSFTTFPLILFICKLL
jgi:hypothetical protein